MWYFHSLASVDFSSNTSHIFLNVWTIWNGWTGWLVHHQPYWRPAVISTMQAWPKVWGTQWEHGEPGNMEIRWIIMNNLSDILICGRIRELYIYMAFLPEVVLLGCLPGMDYLEKIIGDSAEHHKKDISVDPICRVSTSTDPWCAGDSGNQKSTGEKDVGTSLVKQLQTEWVEFLMFLCMGFYGWFAVRWLEDCAGATPWSLAWRKTTSRAGKVKLGLVSMQEPGFGTSYR